MTAIDATLDSMAGVSAQEAAGRIWRVRTVVYARGALSDPGEGTPLGNLEFLNRLLPQARRYKGVPVAISEVPETFSASKASNLPPGFKPIFLLMDVQASVVDQAIEQAGPIVETIIDLMSFDMGAALRLGQVDVFDVTPPLRLREEREMHTFAEAPFSLNSRAVDMLVVQGRLLGQLPESLDVESSRLAAALRWFVKALSIDLLHDQFIFLWIALEILSDDFPEGKILAPYKGPCGHTIPSCPQCGRATESLVRGPTLKAFLESFGVDTDTARDLWAMRQLMHGAIPFDSKKLKGLTAQVQVLRAVVATALKKRLGKSPTDPPFVAPSGFSIHPSLGVYGTATISEEEMRPLTAASVQQAQT